MLRDNVDVNLDKVPISIDIHAVRAPLTMGVMRGQFKVNINHLFNYIRKAWFKSVEH